MGKFHGLNSPKSSETLGLGLLYNGHAATNVNFAPSGWRVPTLNDVKTLAAFVNPTYDDSNGTYPNSGNALKLNSSKYWSPNLGTNTTGFSAIGSSYRYDTGEFYNLYSSFDMWTTTEIVAGYYYNDCYLSSYDNTVYTRALNGVNYGLSIRLIKNDSTNPGTITDYDGNTYDCVTIGTQVWTKQNWKCKHFSNGVVIPEPEDNYAWASISTPGLCAYNNDWSNV